VQPAPVEWQQASSSTRIKAHYRIGYNLYEFLRNLLGADFLTNLVSRVFAEPRLCPMTSAGKHWPFTRYCSKFRVRTPRRPATSVRGLFRQISPYAESFALTHPYRLYDRWNRV
jgi:hypothetical protein